MNNQCIDCVLMLYIVYHDIVYDVSPLATLKKLTLSYNNSLRSYSNEVNMICTMHMPGFLFDHLC